MAQEEGFEPPTKRLTAACSTTELLLNVRSKVPNLRAPCQRQKSLGINFYYLNYFDSLAFNQSGAPKNPPRAFRPSSNSSERKALPLRK